MQSLPSHSRDSNLHYGPVALAPSSACCKEPPFADVIPSFVRASIFAPFSRQFCTTSSFPDAAAKCSGVVALRPSASTCAFCARSVGPLRPDYPWTNCTWCKSYNFSLIMVILRQVNHKIHHNLEEAFALSPSDHLVAVMTLRSRLLQLLMLQRQAKQILQRTRGAQDRRFVFVSC